MIHFFEKKNLDKKGECFGWCDISVNTLNDLFKQSMCSCKCETWTNIKLANHNYDGRFEKNKLDKEE